MRSAVVILMAPLSLTRIIAPHSTCQGRDQPVFYD